MRVTRHGSHSASIYYGLYRSFIQPNKRCDKHGYNAQHPCRRTGPSWTHFRKGLKADAVQSVVAATWPFSLLTHHSSAQTHPAAGMDCSWAHQHCRPGAGILDMLFWSQKAGFRPVVGCFPRIADPATPAACVTNPKCLLWNRLFDVSGSVSYGRIDL